MIKIVREFNMETFAIVMAILAAALIIRGGLDNLYEATISDE
jgi:hypothetical protein